MSDILVRTGSLRFGFPQNGGLFRKGGLREVIKGVNVHRVASTRFGRGALIGRAMDYLSFYRSVRHRLLAIAKPNDLIVAKTDPPLTSVVARRPPEMSP